MNGIWEGSANVICLDALRAIARSPDALDAIGAEIGAGRDARATALLERARQLLREADRAERNARVIVESLALAAQMSLMRRHSDAQAAEAFCASRARGQFAFGTLENADTGALLRRAMRD